MMRRISPAEVDFSKGVRVFITPARRADLSSRFDRAQPLAVFNERAQKQGVDSRDLLTDTLKHDIEINEALK